MPNLEKIIAPMWIYAALSLTLVRMLPVGLAMIGSKLHLSSILFLGWFGPRGLASIILGLIFVEQKTNLSVEPVIVLAIIATVLLSVFAHGISSAPAINLYARQTATLESGSLEKQKIVEMTSSDKRM